MKGYVPGYFGNDFLLLTEQGRLEVVKEWITRGVSSRLVDHPVTGTFARYFLERQAVHMPKFDDLNDAQVGVLARYVVSLNGFGPMDALGLRAYANATQRRLIQRRSHHLEGTTVASRTLAPRSKVQALTRAN